MTSYFANIHDFKIFFSNIHDFTKYLKKSQQLEYSLKKYFIKSGTLEKFRKFIFKKIQNIFLKSLGLRRDSEN